MKRLDATLSSCGIGSRSEVRTLIKRGKVQVNGNTVTDFSAHISESDTVTVNGIKINTSEFVYLCLNKPCGYVTTTDTGEKNVIELVPAEFYRKGLFPAGRLDKDTSGLLIITNDGDFGHLITSPNKHKEKEYIVRTAYPLTEEYITRFAKGMTLKDGLQTKPAILKILDTDTASVIITEGKYHQVRRMFAACGNRVTELKRVRIGNLRLNPDLAEGQIRVLTDDEINNLKL